MFVLFLLGPVVNMVAVNHISIGVHYIHLCSDVPWSAIVHLRLMFMYMLGETFPRWFYQFSFLPAAWVIPLLHILPTLCYQFYWWACCAVSLWFSFCFSDYPCGVSSHKLIGHLMFSFVRCLFKYTTHYLELSDIVFWTSLCILGKSPLLVVSVVSGCIFPVWGLPSNSLDSFFPFFLS